MTVCVADTTRFAVRFPFGNDRKNGKCNGKSNSGCFAALSMTSFVVVGVSGWRWARIWLPAFVVPTLTALA